MQMSAHHPHESQRSSDPQSSLEGGQTVLPGKAELFPTSCHNDKNSYRTATDFEQHHKRGCSQIAGHSSQNDSHGSMAFHSMLEFQGIPSRLSSDTGRTGPKEDDVERGPAYFERITLSIDGLQCGCCESSVVRALTRIASIQNYQVNLVLARVDFELDTHRQSVTEVIESLQENTGYRYEELAAPAGQVLEVFVTEIDTIQGNEKPQGVTHVEFSGKYPWNSSKSPSGYSSASLVAPSPNSPPFTSIKSGNVKFIWSRLRTSTRSTVKKEHLIRIHYDAGQIGAREIYDHYLRHNVERRLAPLAPHPSLAVGFKQTKRTLQYFLPSLFCTIPVVFFAWGPVSNNKLAYDHVSLALATVVQGIAIKEFVPNAVRTLWRLHIFEMDFLVATSSTMAYIFSVVSYVFKIMGRPLDTGSFFETSTMLVTMILLGRVINEFARYRATKFISFRSLQIEEALLVLPTSKNLVDPIIRKIDARLLQYGDLFKIPAHSSVVTDGTVVYGGSEIDESMITGESVPVAKGVHSTVYAGTTNGGGVLIVKLTALPHENAIHKIAAMVEQAQLTKPRTQALADKIAGWFVPVMAILSIIVFVVWLVVGRLHKNYTWTNTVIEAIKYAMAVLIVSCPCAIGLAVPMVILIAGGVAARSGIIFRDPHKLEVARNVTDVVFDKTGTLTCGTLTVTNEQFHFPNRARVKQILLSLLQDIKHPVAVAVLLHLQRDARMNPQNNSPPIHMTNITSIPGCGVQGTLKENNLTVRAGNPDWLNLDLPPTNCTIFCVTIGIHAATFQLQDRPRHTASLVIERLQARGIRTHMISGDSRGAVDDTAHTLNIPKRYTKSRCTPEGKRAYVRDLQQPKRTIMFVGDGTNDSVALKQADVGVHITQSSSSDVARSAADIVLTTPRLHDVLILLDISRAAYRRVITNFVWAGVYNVSAIFLAAGTFTMVMQKARIEPQWAGLGELVSVLPVVLVAFQMRWRDYGRHYRRVEYDGMRVDGEAEREVVRMRSTRSEEMKGGRCCPFPGRQREK